MIPEHMHKLRDIADNYKVSLPDLMETYSHLQTKYLKRDLDQGKYHSDIVKCSQYGNKAIEVMERYCRMKSK